MILDFLGFLLAGLAFVFIIYFIWFAWDSRKYLNGGRDVFEVVFFVVAVGSILAVLAGIGKFSVLLFAFIKEGLF